MWRRLRSLRPAIPVAAATDGTCGLSKPARAHPHCRCSGPPLGGGAQRCPPGPAATARPRPAHRSGPSPQRANSRDPVHHYSRANHFWNHPSPKPPILVRQSTHIRVPGAGQPVSLSLPAPRRGGASAQPRGRARALFLGVGTQSGTRFGVFRSRRAGRDEGVVRLWGFRCGPAAPQPRRSDRLHGVTV